MTHDLTKALIARRVVVHAGSSEGRRLSMTSEIVKNLPLAETDWQRANMAESLARITREIPQIRADGGQYVHGNHFPGQGAM